MIPLAHVNQFHICPEIPLNLYMDSQVAILNQISEVEMRMCLYCAHQPMSLTATTSCNLRLVDVPYLI